MRPLHRLARKLAQRVRRRFTPASTETLDQLPVSFRQPGAQTCRCKSMDPFLPPAAATVETNALWEKVPRSGG